MRDWSKPLRTSYFTALNGNVFLDVAEVPVFQMKVADHLPSDNYIIIGTTQGNNASTFPVWETDAFINIEIVVNAQSEVGDRVDDISDQVKNLILPTRNTTGLPAQAGFQFTAVQLDGENDIPIIQAENKIEARKILRFRQHIVDNN